MDQAGDILRPGHVAQGRDGSPSDIAIDAGDLLQERGHRRRSAALVENLDEQGPAALVLGRFHGVDERLVNAIGEHCFQAVPGRAGRIAAVLDGLHQQGHGRAVTNPSQGREGRGLHGLVVAGRRRGDRRQGRSIAAGSQSLQQGDLPGRRQCGQAVGQSLDSLAVDAGDEANRHAGLEGITAGQDLQDRCGRVIAGGTQQAFQASQSGRLVRLIEQDGDRSGLVRSAFGGQPLAALRQGIANLEADRTACLLQVPT